MSDTVLIVGGSSGIGLETAVMLHKRGLDLILVGSSDAKLMKAKDRLKNGPSVETWQADLSSPDGFRGIVQQIDALEEHVRMKYMVFAAGFGIFGDFVDSSEETYDKYSNMSKALFFISQATARRMKTYGEGSIVNVSTVLSEQADIKAAAASYVFSKGAMNSLTKQLASELAADQIRVNCVLPGAVETPIFDGMPPEDVSNMLAAWAKSHPLGRVGQPEEVARVITLLLMDASWVTGVLWNVDGGMLAAKSG